MSKPPKPETSERKCVVTGKSQDKTTLIRFVLGPEQQVVPDIANKLPGRGVWITAKQDKVQEAVKQKAFHRGFAKQVVVSSEIDQQVSDLLEKAALGHLKMANKAGALIFGFTKLMAAIEKQAIIALIHAAEASPQEAEKLEYKFRTNLEQRDKTEQNHYKKPFNRFKTSELNLAFGAANVIYAGLKENGAARAAIKAMERHRVYHLNS